MKNAVGLLALWLALSLGAIPLRKNHNQFAPSRPPERLQDLGLELIGEFRTVLARFLWFKMDALHEQGEVLNTIQFKEKEIIPLLRMVTYLDPTFVDAYDTASFELQRGFNKLDEAIALIDEGLKYNPDNFVLLFRRAYFADLKKSNYEQLAFANRAWKAAADDAQRISTLRLILRAAKRADEPQLGVTVLDQLHALGAVTPLYEADEKRWRLELSRQAQQQQSGK